MEKNKIIDARGLSCPQPALMTRQALSSLSAGTLQVLVDTPTARDNVVRTAENAGCTVAVSNIPDGTFQLSITK